MKALNKYQVETAEELLKSTLTKKVASIVKAAFETDMKKLAPAIVAFNKKALALRQEAVNLKKLIEKNAGLEFDIDGYSSLASKLPKSLEEAEEYGSSVKIKGYSTSYDHKRGGSYVSSYGKYAPDTSKEEREIDEFVLALKLGTATTTDLQPLLAKLEKIK